MAAQLCKLSRRTFSALHAKGGIIQGFYSFRRGCLSVHYRTLFATHKLCPKKPNVGLYMYRYVSSFLRSSTRQAEENKTESAGETLAQRFRYSTHSLSDSDLRKSVERLTEKFMEARELLDDAKTSHGTVYFSEDMKEAQDSVKQTLEDYKDLLETLSEMQKQNVVRTIGLRMEELKAQQKNVEELLRTE